MDPKKLSSKQLVLAYAQGYFPMPDSDTEVMNWYRPQMRGVIPLDGFHVSRSLRRTLRRGGFSVSYNKDFRGVMDKCADRDDTWINDEIKRSYTELHKLGLCHSVEVWKDGVLAGGLYGVAIGGGFFAESMFHSVTNASKVALHTLVLRLKHLGFVLLECQFLTDHLRSLGAVEISDAEYQARLQKALQLEKYF